MAGAGVHPARLPELLAGVGRTEAESEVAAPRLLSFRRRGMGLAMTHAPLVAARAAGLSHAILQAAEAGV